MNELKTGFEYKKIQMKDKKIKSEFLFGKKNYRWMLIGLLFIAAGFSFMAGGGSDKPELFNEALYNFQRIRLAPTLVLIGFGIEVYAILLNPKK